MKNSLLIYDIHASDSRFPQHCTLYIKLLLLLLPPTLMVVAWVQRTVAFMCPSVALCVYSLVCSTRSVKS